ncbi:uncharacterized protein LOC123497983 [Portunus trituberculatus]|uniref:uncharacterized protein LOC123497983 n=1 Tax=Portunus trituberculatus TaxID=210409 RepID=UPI001E1CB0EE|nr:uncharacterized protein LOC123497983 [Portunus trituberculatus]XP_045100951.1 uncharacterized protein LOC123497983 [Portunus trituberculatus]XP_045100953.1 uncharacterized protein LOC123497983 [Portunus trituberculatus]
MTEYQQQQQQPPLHPPTYEVAMLGQPYVIAPMLPYQHYESTLQHYVQMSTAPSAPPLSPSPTQIQEQRRFWNHYGLDLVMGFHQIYLHGRTGDKYLLTDATKSLLYTAAIDVETTCFCCTVPRGPGVTFNLTSRNHQHVLTVHRSTQAFWCSSQETEVDVKIPPDVMIGTVEGKGENFTLINPSGDITCYVEKEDEACCSCSNASHKVVPVGFPHDLGSLTRTSTGLVITFPAVLDVATRLLLTCCALNLQYAEEEERKTSS